MCGFFFANPKRPNALRGFNFCEFGQNSQNSQKLILARINPLKVINLPIVFKLSVTIYLVWRSF